MNGISTVFLKQVKETLKNKAIMIQFVMFPLLAVIMENSIRIDEMPEHFFAKLFAVMFIGMAPLTCMSSVISEEKEKNTLRVLMMSNVKPVQYLLGIGSYVWIMCMIGAAVFAVLGEYKGADLAGFMLVMAVGIILSILVGAVIGIISKNQMSATSVTVPVMMIFSFLPMLSMFNETIEKIAKITYSQQINILVNSNFENVSNSIVVLAINFILATLLFFIAYHNNGME
ncbi:MAG: ABC transporter permease [Oscillospiraceae bacterium]|nr:ABC transporter permease [Oscillospiraceae bacterium]